MIETLQPVMQLLSVSFQDFLKQIYHMLPVFIWNIIWMFVVAACVLGFVSINVMLLVWGERKVAARIQNRMGPMMTGPSFLNKYYWTGGILQSLADGVKLLMKEDIIPKQADKWVFIAAPVMVFAATMMNYAVVPFGENLTILKEFNVGLLYLMAVGAYTTISILMAGWGSNNKYSLLGGIRSAAQAISYEIPMGLALLGVVIMTGTLNIDEIIRQQHGWKLYLFLQPVAFMIFIISAVAETNRPPFDLPEAESELVAGFHTEYSGMRFAMFFLAEFANMFVSAAIAAAIFLGGWMPPIPVLSFIPTPVWFLIKTYIIVLIFMWFRWTFPRIRVDQLMEFSWKVLTPIALINIVVTAVAVLLKGVYSSPWWLLITWLPLVSAVLITKLKSRKSLSQPVIEPTNLRKKAEAAR